jgi:membrane carboxypeptidase/penicillin-binding protein PbpC
MNKYNAASAPVLNVEQTNLQRIDLRMRGLTVNSPESPELARMEAARKDVLSRMTKQEVLAYEQMTRTPKSNEQLKAEAEAERIAMDANKDKPPI